MSLLTQPSSSQRRGLQIPTPVFAAIVVLLAIIAGWLVYQQIFQVQEIDLTQYESLNTPTARARQQFAQGDIRPTPPNAGIGILHRNDGFDVQIVGARARFIRQNNDLTLNARFIDNNLFNPRDRAATYARFQALRNPDGVSENLKITPEQLQKLRQIQVPREMSLSDTDKQKLLEMGKRYLDAPADQKKTLETELTETFRKIASQALQPTLAAYADSANRIREVLTEQQISALGRNR